MTGSMLCQEVDPVGSDGKIRTDTSSQMSLISREDVKSLLTFMSFSLLPTFLIDIVDGFPKGPSIKD